MNLPPYVFDVDHIANIRSELSTTVLEKKLNKITAQIDDLKHFRALTSINERKSFRILSDKSDIFLDQITIIITLADNYPVTTVFFSTDLTGPTLCSEKFADLSGQEFSHGPAVS